MKKLFTLLLLLFVIVLSGCTDKSSSKEEQPKAETSETSSVGTESQADFDDSESLNNKLNFYNTSTYFPDALIPHKYLIVNSNSVVSVQFLGSAETVTEIPKESISRKENQSVGTFSVLNIFDKTGKSISFNIGSDNIENVLSILDN